MKRHLIMLIGLFLGILWLNGGVVCGRTGDVDGDYKVDLQDLDVMANEWLSQREPYIEVDGFVVMEAEHYYVAEPGTGLFDGSQWVYQTVLSAANDGVMYSPDMSRKIDSDYVGVSPRLSLQVQFQTVGHYYLWVKAMGPNATADSLHYGFDGVAISNDRSSAMALEISDDFLWMDHQSDDKRMVVDVTEVGLHTLDFWVREDGVKIDRVLMTTDVSYDPRVEEPVESLGYVGLASDLNANGAVNQQDFAILASQWQQPGRMVEISEVMTDNEESVVTRIDGMNAYPDWIELHNLLERDVLDLGGWYLTDEADNLTKWAIPDDVIVQAGGYVCFFASGRDDAQYPYMDVNGYYHTNFQLSNNGEYLALVNPQGEVVHAFDPGVPSLPNDYSYGMLVGQELYFSGDSFGSENTSAFLGFVDDTKFNVNRGFFDEGFELKLSCATEGAVVRYTLDGSTPSMEHGITYEENTGFDWRHDEGRIDGALAYDGVNNHVEVVGYQGILGSSARTVSAWIKTDVVGNMDIISWGSTSDVGGRWMMVVQAWFGTKGTIQLDVNGGLLIGSTVVCDGEWHHVAVVYDGNGAGDLSLTQIYVDGVVDEIARIENAAVNTVADSSVRIGGSSDGGQRYFEGLIDDVRIYSRGLSNTEVADLAAVNGGDITDLNVHWAFDEVSGSVVADTMGVWNGVVHGGLYIDRTTIVRARGFKDGYIATNVDTNTYLFLNDVIHQSANGERPGSGWPEAGEYAGQMIDYGMDPDIVNDDRYKDQIIPALQAIPSISLVMPLDYLFSSNSGIYVNARQDGIKWERLASIELINPDGSDGFQEDCGVRIRGGYSRSGSNPKHAFRLLFKKYYGAGKLKFPMFEDEGADRFDNMDLRTSQNYSWSFEGDSRFSMLREVFSRDTQRAMGKPYTRSRYYHLYINGQYWGIYMTQERSEASYAETYFGGNKDDYDVVKVNTDANYTIAATDGNLDAWRRLWQAIRYGVDDDLYYELQGLNPDGTENPEYEKLVDVENLIDYMLCTYFVGDRDAPISEFLGNDQPNNFYAIYNRENPDGFKFMRHDAEHSLLEYNDRTGPYIAGANFIHFNPQWLHQQLVGSHVYRMRFADRVHEHFFNNGLLTPDQTRARIMARRDMIDLAIIAESARWGDSKRGNPRNRNDDWVPEVNTLLNSYLPMRTDMVLDQLRYKGWYPSVTAPEYYVGNVHRHGGMLAENEQITFNNTNGTIYYSTCGVDPMTAEMDKDSIVIIEESAEKQVMVPSGFGDIVSTDESMFVVNRFVSSEPVVDLFTAMDVLSNPSWQQSRTTSRVQTINFVNGGINDDHGHFNDDVAYPGLTLMSDSDNYVVEISGAIEIPYAGEWSFGVNSDDGFGLILSNGNPADTIEMYYFNAEPAGDVIRSFMVTTPGIYRLNLVTFEHTGSARVELFAAQGAYSNWVGDEFHLVGDTAAGGLAVCTLWNQTGYGADGWANATGGVGYDTRGGLTNYINYDVENEMLGQQGSCFVRIPFDLDMSVIDDYEDFVLSVRYDDGFIAYLNGVEIARKNADFWPVWNDTSIGEHDDVEAMDLVEFDVSGYKDLLVDGENVLAIHGLNSSVDNSNALISAMLEAARIMYYEYDPYSAINLDRSATIIARTRSGSTWSALSKATFGVGPVVESLRVTELMYHPEELLASDPCGVEYVELKNIGTASIDLALVQFTKGITFTFDHLVVEPGGLVVVVNDLDGFNQVYPGFTGVIAGEFSGKLDNAGEQIVLVDAIGQVIQDFEFKDGWHPLSDGDGYSLTIIEASNPDLSMWSNEDGWAASTHVSGSPGEEDPVIPDHTIVINEVLAHSHATDDDWIELYNTSDTLDVNIGGWYLSDKDDTDADLKRYRIPDNTWLNAGEYIIFYEDTSFGAGNADPCSVPFALSENGDQVYLSSGSAGLLTGYRESVDFGASSTGVTFGRYSKTDGDNTFVMLSSATPMEENSGAKTGPICITEFMYNPASGDQDEEYIELMNVSDTAVPLYNSITQLPWKFIDGIEYTFPTNPPLTIEPGEKVIIASDPVKLMSRYGAVLDGVTVLGPFEDGKLSNGGEDLELGMPGDVDSQGTRYYIRVDRVDYLDGVPWPDADGNGMSLHRISDDAFGNDAGNWRASLPTPGN